MELPPLDPSLYPRSYRSVRFWKSPPFWSALIAIAASMNHMADVAGAPWVWLVPLILFTPIALLAFSYKTVLRVDRIERVGPAGIQIAMLRANVVGQHFGRRPNLVSGQPGDRPFPLPKGARQDAAWDAWMAGIPDLDIQIEAAALANPALGDAPEQRERQWRRALGIGNALFVGSCILGVVTPFLTGPSHLAATVGLMLLPWLGILYLWRWGDILAPVFTQTQKLRLANPFFVLCITTGVAAFGLLFIGYNGSSLVQGAFVKGLVCTSIIFSTYSAAYFMGARMSRTMPGCLFSPIILCIALCYAVCLMLCANKVFDFAPPTPYVATILEKFALSDRRHGPSLSIRLSPWGPQRAPSVASTALEMITKDDFDDYRVGDRVCVVLHPGFLTIEWWRLGGNCP